jgi:hypothetical protein
MNHLEIGELGAAIVLVVYAAHKLRQRRPGKPPALSAAYGHQIVLTPAMLERVNMARQRFRCPMFNEIGFRNAIAHVAETEPGHRPKNLVDLLTYLILFEVADKRYYQSTDAGNTKFSIYVRPGEYNLGMGAVANDVGRASHWGCRSTTPARETARKIALTMPAHDVYADFAAATK